MNSYTTGPKANTSNLLIKGIYGVNAAWQIYPFNKAKVTILP